MNELQEKAQALTDFAFSTDNGMSVACIPWSLIWGLRDAIDFVPDKHAENDDANS